MILPTILFLGVKFDGDGELLAIGSDDSNVRLWRLTFDGGGNGNEEWSAKLVARLKGHSKAINAVAFGKDGKSLAKVT